jgi:hypothetical protein
MKKVCNSDSYRNKATDLFHTNYGIGLLRYNGGLMVRGDLRACPDFGNKKVVGFGQIA